MKNLWKYCLMIFVAGALVSCGGDEEDGDGNDAGTKITGNISGANGQMVSLWVFEEEGERKIDSVVIADDQFVLHTETNELREYVLEVGRSIIDVPNPPNNVIYVFPDETAGDIIITADFPSVGDNYTISGDENSEDFKAYLDFIQPINEQLNDQNNVSVAAGDELEVKLKALDSIAAQKQAYAIDFINKKPYSPVAWVMLTEFYPPSGLTNFDSENLEYFELVAEEMRAKYPYSDYPVFIDKSIENTLAQLEQLDQNEGGELAADLAYEDPDGKVIKLSDLRGQVVLIDFWASWCGPCRQENPNVVKTYNKYKDKGFTIYSVSLDTDKSKWIEAIKIDNLSWPNHVSDLKGWQSEAAAKYEVNSIPATFLLDKEGRIIDQNLRGGRLEQRLQEILG